MHARPSHRATHPRRRLRAAAVAGLVALVVLGAGQSGRSAPVSASTSTDQSLQSYSSGDDDARTTPEQDVAAADLVPAEDAATTADEAAAPMPDLSGLTLPQLQARAASMQADFIKASVRYEQAADDAEAAKDAADEAETKAAVALAEADQAGEVMGQQLQEYYTDVFFGTHNVRGVADTVNDLAAGLAGMAVYVGLYALRGQLRRKRRGHTR